MVRAWPYSMTNESLHGLVVYAETTSEIRTDLKITHRVKRSKYTNLKDKLH